MLCSCITSTRSHSPSETFDFFLRSPPTHFFLILFIALNNSKLPWQTTVFLDVAKLTLFEGLCGLPAFQSQWRQHASVHNVAHLLKFMKGISLPVEFHFSKPAAVKNWSLLALTSSLWKKKKSREFTQQVWATRGSRPLHLAVHPDVSVVNSQQPNRLTLQRRQGWDAENQQQLTAELGLRRWDEFVGMDMVEECFGTTAAVLYSAWYCCLKVFS